MDTVQLGIPKIHPKPRLQRRCCGSNNEGQVTCTCSRNLYQGDGPGALQEPRPPAFFALGAVGAMKGEATAGAGARS